jgi:hypothetical protein
MIDRCGDNPTQRGNRNGRLSVWAPRACMSSGSGISGAGQFCCSACVCVLLSSRLEFKYLQWFFLLQMSSWFMDMDYKARFQNVAQNGALLVCTMQNA